MISIPVILDSVTKDKAMAKKYKIKMNNQRLDEIRERMVLATKHTYDLRRDTGKRCPTIKQMAEYINIRLPHLKAVIQDWSEYKGRKAGRVYYSGQSYRGLRLVVTNRKTGEELLDHRTTETYRMNYEVAKFIIKNEKTN